MRESIGGQWFFGIAALFIALFSGFLAYSISYTKAFKAKNEIINIIEKNEGFSKSRYPDNLGQTEDIDNSVENLAYLIVNNMGYNTRNIDCTGFGSYQSSGYCVQRTCSSSGGNPKIYYKITTFIKINIPVIGIDLKIPIMGETKAMYYEKQEATSSWAGDATANCK